MGFKKVGLMLSGASAFLSGVASAAVPTEVTTAITSAGEDATSVVYALAIAGVTVLAATWVYRKVRG